MTDLSGPGFALQAAGALMGAIGEYYRVKSAKNQARAEALNLEFQASMSDINARQAEIAAQDLIRAGHHEVGRLGIQAAQERGAFHATTGGSGTVAGVGSSAELEASARLIQEIDALTITENSVRAAGEARLQGVGLRNRAALARVSATNVRSYAATLSPWLAAGTSLIGGASSVASRWNQYQSS